MTAAGAPRSAAGASPRHDLASLMDPRIIPRSEHPISRRQIDPDALKVLYRLHRHGKIAHLVGGSVRDLLLGIRPKDFDIATDARPGEVKRLFRNSWIVGRRFRLVHVVFGKKVVEVATFRAKADVEEPEGVVAAPGLEMAAGERGSRGGGGEKKGGAGSTRRQLLVTWENTFGTPEEDARRRDFTINALFYDIASYSIIDYVGGLSDLEDRAIRTIGEPDIRFQEDPVRMMRAVKFAARLGFRIEPETLGAIRRHNAAIELSAPPRLLEEIYRLLGSGCAETSFRLLQDTGLLARLLPELGPVLEREPGLFWGYLAELDRLVRAGEETVPRAVQMATILYHLVRDVVTTRAPAGDSLGDQVQAVVRPLALRLRLTRADTARMIQVFLAQRRLLHPKGRRFSVPAFVRRGYFPGAFQLFRIHAAAAGGSPHEVKRWAERVRDAMGESDPPVLRGEGPAAGAGGRKRRRRRRRRSRATS